MTLSFRNRNICVRNVRRLYDLEASTRYADSCAQWNDDPETNPGSATFIQVFDMAKVDLRCNVYV